MSYATAILVFWRLAAQVEFLGAGHEKNDEGRERDLVVSRRHHVNVGWRCAYANWPP